jgi:vancomycin permeability regulator SanA
MTKRAQLVHKPLNGYTNRMHHIRTTIQSLLHYVRHHKYLVLIVIMGISVILVAPMTYTFTSTRGNRFDLTMGVKPQDIPYHRVGIVFGAGLQPNNQPSWYLQWRIETAVTLYKTHRVDELLMSGDNSRVGYNEPAAMKQYAMKLGVPGSAIAVDDAGFNTYDTCYRARAIFGLRDATLISQGYHLPRAMTTCRGLGITNTGVIATHPHQDYQLKLLVREVLSTDKMVFQQIAKPKPKFLGSPLPL